MIAMVIAMLRNCHGLAFPCTSWSHTSITASSIAAVMRDLALGLSVRVGSVTTSVGVNCCDVNCVLCYVRYTDIARGRRET
jgi:hypothetical protein